MSTKHKVQITYGRNMAWYSASAIFIFKPLSGPARHGFMVHENIYLVQADNHEDASSLAESIAKSTLIDDPILTIDDVPAECEFLGIRKTVEISNPIDVDEKCGPVHGTEVTYSEYSVDSYEDALKLSRGESVDLTYF